MPRYSPSGPWHRDGATTPSKSLQIASNPHKFHLLSPQGSLYCHCIYSVCALLLHSTIKPFHPFTFFNQPKPTPGALSNGESPCPHVPHVPHISPCPPCPPCLYSAACTPLSVPSCLYSRLYGLGKSYLRITCRRALKSLQVY